MKKGAIVAAAGLGIVLASAWADAQGEKGASNAGADLKDLKAKVSYSIGLDIGKQMKNRSVDVDADVLARGIKDSMAGKSQMTEEQVKQVQQEFQKVMIAKQAEIAEQRKKEGDTFLAANKQKQGIKTLPSGLQYQVVKEGTGKTPRATDTVTANYEGRLIDGTVFDSSYKRGMPADFPLNQVIRGWTEALQLMKVGSKWTLFIPAEMAYGAQPPPGSPIRPNDPLIFDIELLDVKSTPAAP